MNTEAGFIERHMMGHVRGNAGIGELWVIALPMVISSTFDVLVMFIGRMFLSRVDSLQMAAMMTGGLTCFTASTFFIGMISYSGAIIAHLYGAGRKKDCSRMLTQAVMLAMLAYPMVLCLIPVGLASFSWAGHSARQIALESRFFIIAMVFTSFFSLLRVPFAAFFSGIGATSRIMFANFAGLASNVIISYILIFGKFGFPKLEITGAAIAISISSAVNLAALAFFYFRRKNISEFGIVKSFVFNRLLMGRLIRFGFPSGLEFFINLSAFTAMVTMFHSYGENMAAAVTIVYNWDMIAFLPMVGLQISVITLVGQNLGRKNEAGAIRATYSGLKLNFLFSGFMLMLFLCLPKMLVGFFRPEVITEEWNKVAGMAVPMLMMMSIYPVTDGIFIVFSGAIRGAGDTAWAMVASGICHWGGTLYTFILTHRLRLEPVTAWNLFLLIFPVLSLVFWLRFRSGRWKGKNVIPPEEALALTDLEPTPATPLE